MCKESKAELSQGQIKQQIRQLAEEFGFSRCTFAPIELGEHEQHLKNWLDEGLHADLDYMANHGSKRYRPEELVPDTKSIICLRMDYLNPELETINLLKQSDKAYISRYALGRDYHKLIRKRLTQLAKAISELLGEFGRRAFVDSAPVLERGLAQLSGSGWIGKNTMLIDRKFGSWFFLGEIFTDLELEPDEAYEKNHCGKCTSCIDYCPTGAIIAPYKVDAAKCISYLTIEYDGIIPVELRKNIGNRIFGCDDCQLFCPWNRFAQPTKEADFAPRHQLDQISLLECLAWSEDEFMSKTEGSPIRRTGYRNWLRNILVALGNGPSNVSVLDTLKDFEAKFSEDGFLLEHSNWAIKELEARLQT